jgi:WD40 repeat protein
MTGHYAANAKWTNEVWGLSLMSDNDEFVTCSDDSTVRIWNMKKR